MAVYRAAVMAPTLKPIPSGDTLDGVGNMNTSVYDPNVRAQNAFARANHIGTQPVATITGLGTAATMNVGTGPNTVASGDHVHGCCPVDMFAHTYDPQHIAGNAFDRRFHTGTQPLSTISDAGVVARLNVGTGPNTVAAGDHVHSWGGMTTLVYDPTNVRGSFFTRANHTGTQPHTSITGLGTCAGLNVGTGPNTVAAGDHVHYEFMGSAYTDGGVASDFFARASHVGTIPWSTIEGSRMVGASTTLDGHGGIVGAPLSGSNSLFLQGNGSYGSVTGVITIDEYGEMSSRIGGRSLDETLDRQSHIGTQPVTSVIGWDFPLVSNRDTPDNQVGLDADAKIDAALFPVTLTSSVVFVGTWDASTNNPSIPSPIGRSGNYYRVSVAGTTDVNGVSDWKQGDYLICEAETWRKMDGSNVVTSVVGRTGDVTLSIPDLSDYSVGTGTQLTYNATSGKWSKQVANVGDMQTSVYGGSLNGVVSDTRLLAGASASTLLTRSEHTGTQSASTITGFGPGATLNFGTTADSLASGAHQHAFGDMYGNNGLSELSDVSVARTNLGISEVATSVFGNGGSDVARAHHDHSLSSFLSVVPTDGQVLRFSTVWEPVDASTGDMGVDVYDPTSSGVVRDAAKLGGQLPEYYLNTANHTGSTPVAAVTGFGPGATLDLGVSYGSLARGDHTHAYGNMFGTNNLSELTDPAVARANLGISEMMLTVSGTGNDEFAPGEHFHTLASLTDVNVVGVGDTDVLRFMSGTWVRSTWNPSDMQESMYVVNGVINDADALSGQPASHYLDRSNHSGTQPYTTVTGWGPLAITPVFGQTVDDLARGDHVHDGPSGYGDMFGANNLSELTDVVLAKQNLGLSDISEIELGVGYEDAARGTHGHALMSMDFIGTPNVGEFLMWSATAGAWVPDPASVVISLQELVNTAPITPTINDLLLWDTGTSTWTPTSVSLSVSVCADVSSTGATTGAVLKWEPSGWTARPYFEEARTLKDMRVSEMWSQSWNLRIGLVGSQAMDDFSDLSGIFSYSTMYANDVGFSLASPIESQIVSNSVSSGEITEAYLLFIIRGTFDLNNIAVRFNTGVEYLGTNRKVVSWADDWHCVLSTCTINNQGTQLSWRINTESFAHTLESVLLGWGRRTTVFTNREATLTQPLGISSYSEGSTSHGNVAGDVVVDASLGTHHEMTLTGHANLTISGLPIGATHVLLIIHGNGNQVTWTNQVTWLKTDGSQPVLRATGVDFINLVWDGHRLLGSNVQPPY